MCYVRLQDMDGSNKHCDSYWKVLCRLFYYNLGNLQLLWGTYLDFKFSFCFENL